MSLVPHPDKVQEHFDSLAENYDAQKAKNYYYYQTIKSFLKSIIPANSKVLEVGCATGQVLAYMEPASGVGIDISPEMIKLAQKKFPQYQFFSIPMEDFQYAEKFDYIILVDVVDHVFDIDTVLRNLYKLCHAKTQVIITTINPIWDSFLEFTERFSAKLPEGPHNFFDEASLARMFELSNFYVEDFGYLLLFPKGLPFFSDFVNRWGTKIKYLNRLSFVQYLVARPQPPRRADLTRGCSVIIEETGDVARLKRFLENLPKLGEKTEVVIMTSPGASISLPILLSIAQNYVDIKLVECSLKRSRLQNLIEASNVATQEVVLLLNSQLSIASWQIPRLVEPIHGGSSRFVIGNRFVYRSEYRDLGFPKVLWHRVINKIISGLLKQRVHDVYSGIKAFYKRDFEHYLNSAKTWDEITFIREVVRAGHRLEEVPIHLK